MSKIKIVTWNINSIRARHDRLLQVLSRHRPDVFCLQEIKCEDKDFPGAAIAEQGYESFIFGQKSYNGVAILVKKELAQNIEINRGFVGSEAYGSRFIEVDFGYCRVAST